MPIFSPLLALPWWLRNSGWGQSGAGHAIGTRPRRERRPERPPRVRRLYPTVSEMKIFVRAVDKKHAGLLTASGAIALETGPMYSSLMLGGAILSSLGMPQDEVLSMIDEKRTNLFKDQERHQKKWKEEQRKERRKGETSKEAERRAERREERKRRAERREAHQSLQERKKKEESRLSCLLLSAPLSHLFLCPPPQSRMPLPKHAHLPPAPTAPRWP